ncbi:U-box domain-containing protein 21 [Forsythia ovata]|uniref:U-box domain-containing protein n=1 Tax=Forsythia ovata TaxID=205694 RepID=A0ABD1W7Q4_9LAMI
MISSWRKKKAARRAAKKHDSEKSTRMELKIPDQFRCPISLDLMKDPVTLSSGMTYDRESIEAWFEAGNTTCPITNRVLRNLEPIPNHALRGMIQDWCVEKRSYGIERIPTPRIPITSVEVSEILSKVEAADEQECLELVVKMRSLAKESERNKRCIMANGTGRVLSSKFEAFSRDSIDKHVSILEEIMSTLTVISPLDEETKHILGSKSSLRCIVWCLSFGNLSGRRNAVLVLKSILSSDQQKVRVLFEIEGAIEALVKLVKEPICPTTTKASLLAIYHMVSSSTTNYKDDVTKRFVDTGLVEVLIDMLVACEKSICEKALGVLDGICNSNEGREKAYENALTMPVLVKKLLRVSDLSTEFSVSIMWKLGKNDTRDERGVIFEAVELGAFQKMLLLLQVGTTEKTKENATHLLKLMNLYRNRVECIDSSDFKDLKRPF